MKSLKTILVLIFLFTNHLMISQHKTSIISLSQRLSSTPFRQTSSIMLVSFNLKFNDEMQIEKIVDSLKTDIHLNKDKIDDFSQILNKDNNVLNKIDQKKLLNLKEIIDLTDILFNTCAHHKINHFNEIGCYFPRNAILFLDSNNNIISYMEICFECRKIKMSSVVLKQKYICDFLLSDLETFFNKVGIKTKYEK